MMHLLIGAGMFASAIVAFSAQVFLNGTPTHLLKNDD